MSSIEAEENISLTGNGALGHSHGGSTHGRAGHLGGQAGGENTGSGHCAGCEERRGGDGVLMG